MSELTTQMNETSGQNEAKAAANGQTPAVIKATTPKRKTTSRANKAATRATGRTQADRENRETAAAAMRAANARGETPADAAADRDAEVLNGVRTSDERPAAPEQAKAPARTPRSTQRAPKPGVTKTVPARKAPTAASEHASAVKRVKAENAAAQPAAQKTPRVTGHRQWAEKEVPAAMIRFSAWIEREFPEFGKVDPRLVTVASKAYRFFQSSDMNR